MSLLKTLQAYLGWCPMEEQVRRPMQSRSISPGDTPHGGRWRGMAGMEIDTIVKEEIWRSIGAVYWVSFLVIGYLALNDYIPIPISYTFSLAVVPTVAHFLIMVWYRRKENLIDPNPVNILRHAIGLREEGKEGTKRRGAVTEKVVDAALLAIIFLIYLYASLTHAISQIYWFPVLLIIGLFLTRIVFTDGGERHVTFVRSVVFYLLAVGIVLLRYRVLGYSINPIALLLLVFALVGSVYLIGYIWEQRRTSEGVD